MKLTRLSRATLSVRGEQLLLDVRDDIQKVSLTLSKNARLYYVLMLANTGDITKKISIRLGEGSLLMFGGILVSSKNGSVKLDLAISHAEPQSQSWVMLRGVVHDSSHEELTGTIAIEKKAQLSSAALEERVLLLGEKSTAKTIPNLEIKADDVKATHAATVSRIPDEQLFYLASRGIPAPDAEQLIIRSFCEAPFSLLPNGEFRASLEAELTSLLAR